MVDLILFPSSYFDISLIDEQLQSEYDAVMATELFDIILFGSEKWFNEGKLIIKNPPDIEKTAVYRGWMMEPKKYESFYNLLLDKNIRLITTPKEYTLMHIFPNVYDFVRQDTAKMVVYPLYSQIDIEFIKRTIGCFMVKDYVKSVKGTEFPKFFDANTTQTEFDNCMDIFYKYRGDLLTGGICIKEYLNLKHYGDTTNEYRVFYINNKIATIGRNSMQPTSTPLPPHELVEKYQNLDSIYYTIDYAELTDGNFKIIETGDGGVSGLPDSQDFIQYYKTLYKCLNDK